MRQNGTSGAANRLTPPTGNCGLLRLFELFGGNNGRGFARQAGRQAGRQATTRDLDEFSPKFDTEAGVPGFSRSAGFFCIEIRCSKMLPGQIGLFAVHNLKKWTIIGLAERLDEKFYAWSDHLQVDRQTKRMIDKYCASTKDGFWGPESFDYLSQPWFMNHSCKGNVGFDDIITGNDWKNPAFRQKKPSFHGS